MTTYDTDEIKTQLRQRRDDEGQRQQEPAQTMPYTSHGRQSNDDNIYNKRRRCRVQMTAWKAQTMPVAFGMFFLNTVL